MSQYLRRQGRNVGSLLFNFWFSTLLLGGVLFGIIACAKNDVSNSAGQKPAFVLEEFFTGKSVAHGIFEDRFGNLRRQFRVNLFGELEGSRLVLEEKFLYDDGERADRTWIIDALGSDAKGMMMYEGRASDVDAVAQGRSAGNSLNWQYDIVLNMSGMDLKVHFDDWIYKQDEDIAINRAYVKKFGVEIGSVTIVFIRGQTALSLWPLQLDQWPSK